MSTDVQTVDSPADDRPANAGTAPSTPTTARTVEPRVRALRRFAVSITVFTILGHLVLGFEQAWAQPIIALAVAYPVELMFETLDAWFGRRRPRFAGGFVNLVDFLLPAHITALAIAMLVYPNDRFVIIAFAVVVALSSKVLFRVRINGTPRHFFNPSNLGIAVTLLLFPSVGIAPPYHFTENISGVFDWLVPAAILASGLMLNIKLTRRGPLVAAWLCGFVAQAMTRSFVFGTPVIAPLLPMSGVAFVLFTNYMITDPGTTPTARRRQIAFGLAVAAAYGILVTMHIVFGLFFALVIVSGLRAVPIALHNVFGATWQRRKEARMVPGGAPAPAWAPVRSAATANSSARSTVR